VPRRIAFTTFGCRLNQCETAGLRAQFQGPGYDVVSPDGPADVFVVNTCSVTGRADAEARRLVRRLLRDWPGSRIVVTGCYAQRAPRELAGIPGVALVAGNAEKDRLRELVDGLWPDRGGPVPAVFVSDLRKSYRSFDLCPVEFGERTRAYLRVQDGCDAACSFCVIPRLRGRSTSLDPALAVERAKRLVEGGYREIILTGIHLGLFGRERSDGSTLARLVDLLEEIPGDFRIRLSSIEPQEIDDALIERLSARGRLVPHVHVPLQSGSDRILKLMNRTYGAADYQRVVERLAHRVDPLGFGADVIVGFPGESDHDFEETRRFIRSLPFTYLHVFSYSPRPGTRAARLPGRPAAEVVRHRSALLRELGEMKKREFLLRFVGRTMRVLVHEPAGDFEWEGLSEHYARVVFPWPGAEDLSNRFVSTIGFAVKDGTIAAEPAEGLRLGWGSGSGRGEPSPEGRPAHGENVPPAPASGRYLSRNSTTFASVDLARATIRT
jgi:threonylcarbamoyladenosine tRNA methylthiotransferase MtaB